MIGKRWKTCLAEPSSSICHGQCCAALALVVKVSMTLFMFLPIFARVSNRSWQQRQRCQHPAPATLAQSVRGSATARPRRTPPSCPGLGSCQQEVSCQPVGKNGKKSDPVAGDPSLCDESHVSTVLSPGTERTAAKWLCQHGLLGHVKS